jgi:DNA-binding CsgD family transcriptional regulator/PAS domain-containing protein
LLLIFCRAILKELGGVSFQSRLSILQSNSELEQFSKTVEKIYDAAIDVSQWVNALAHIIDLTGATCGGIHFGDNASPVVDPKHFHAIGFTDFFNSKINEYAHVWAAQTGMFSWDIGEAHHLADLFPREEFINSRFYREVIEPDQGGDYIGMIALKEGTRFAPFTLSTYAKDGMFSKRNVDMVRLLAPHICRSAKIGLALEMKSLGANLMEATLNSLNAGVFILADDGHLVFANQQAEQLLRRGRGFNLANNRLIAINPVASMDFDRCMASARQSANEFAGATTSIALPDEFGGLVATLLPLGSGLRQNLTRGLGNGGFAIFVQDPMAAAPNPGEGFAKLYGLTHGEIRTVMAISVGQGPQDAADILGLSLATVRSHLQHVFAKTGTSGQSELKQLMMRSAAPISA